MESLKSYKTPLRYPGGKSRACKKMDPYFPDLKEYREYREPFLGGGSVAIHITKKYPDLEIWVNDLYEPLSNFWQQLQHNGQRMCDILLDCKKKYHDPTDEQRKDKEFVYLAEGLFKDSKKVLNEETSSKIDRAIAFYIINKCSFSGLTESSSFSKQASISNFSIRGIEKIPKYQEIIENWRITNKSYIDLLTDWRGTFIYLDPPYDIKDNLYGRKGGMHKMFNHDTFAKDCDNAACNQLISYNSDQLVKDRFDGWNAGEFDLTYTMRSVGNYMDDQEGRKELLLFNYDLNSL
jgi:DNA adenine methylase